MAVEIAMSSRDIVSKILHHLSDMKYKDRRQNGPDEPVEFLEFRPTLVPAILVNRLWADEGTSILWRRYPHSPSLRWVAAPRRQYYADKVHRVFVMSPPHDSPADLDYLVDLQWPNLKGLELEVDFQRHGKILAPMLHGSLEHLELLGIQSGDSEYISDTVLPALFKPCSGLKSVRIGPDVVPEDELPFRANALFDLLDSAPMLNSIEVKGANLMDKDTLFTRLGQRAGLQNLEIDLDPGLNLLPLLSGPDAMSSPFSSLKRIQLMCYPEVALALPSHLGLLEEFMVDIARIPDHLTNPSDPTIIEDIIQELSHCPNLRTVKIGVGLLAADFPSSTSYPTLSGKSVIKLATACPKLDDISILTIEPSAIDGSSISPHEFDVFCETLPQLRSLNLRLHPATSTSLATTALQSLATHCLSLETIRLKIPCQLPTLPVSNPTPQEPPSTEVAAPASPPPTQSQSITHTSPLFPTLLHLAISRPNTALCPTHDTHSTYTASSPTFSTTSLSLALDPSLEESLVRTWALPLTTHFPRLEILEAWGDHTGTDDESLNYFLPMDEVLASTWEFLSGVEQDLWEDDDDDDDDDLLHDGMYAAYNSARDCASEGEGGEGEDSWVTFNSGRSSGEDWKRASLMNEFVVDWRDGGGADVGEGEGKDFTLCVTLADGGVEGVHGKEIFTEADILDHVAH